MMFVSGEIPTTSANLENPETAERVDEEVSSQTVKRRKVRDGKKSSNPKKQKSKSTEV